MGNDEAKENREVLIAAGKTAPKCLERAGGGKSIGPKNESARNSLESRDARRTALPRSLLKDYSTFAQSGLEWHERGICIQLSGNARSSAKTPTIPDKTG